MASESAGSPLVAEHAFPLRVGCMAQGCAVMFLAVIGSVGAATLTAGVMNVSNGNMPLGALLCVVGLIALPALFFAPYVMLTGLREVLKSEYLMLTSSAILLPPRLQEALLDSKGQPYPNSPGPQPAVIPFAAIRSIAVGTGPTGRIRIDHSLAPTTLVLLEYMMTPKDYETLEKLLRAAVPAAFATSPTSPPPK